MNNLFYTDLQIRNYLKCEQITAAEARTIYSYRTRMAVFSDNYRGQKGTSLCPLCGIHLDVQSMSFQCIQIKENVKITGKYENIFEDVIPKQLARTVIEISHYRKQFLEERSLDN